MFTGSGNVLRMDIDPIGVRGVGATRYTYTAIRSGIHGESQGFRRLCKFLIHRICGSCGRRSSGRWWGAGAAARPGATDLREPEGGDASGAQRRPACRSVQPRSTHRHRRCRSRGAKQTRRLREIGNPIHVIAFSLDGQLVAAGAGRGAVQIWQATTGTFQSQFNGMQGKVLTVGFDPATKLVVAAGDRDWSSSRTPCRECPRRHSRGLAVSSWP